MEELYSLGLRERGLIGGRKWAIKKGNDRDKRWTSDEMNGSEAKKDEEVVDLSRCELELMIHQLTPLRSHQHFVVYSTSCSHSCSGIGRLCVLWAHLRTKTYPS